MNDSFNLTSTVEEFLPQRLEDSKSRKDNKEVFNERL